MFPSKIIDILTDTPENEQKWQKMSPGIRQTEGRNFIWFGKLRKNLQKYK